MADIVQREFGPLVPNEMAILTELCENQQWVPRGRLFQLADLNHDRFRQNDYALRRILKAITTRLIWANRLADWCESVSDQSVAGERRYRLRHERRADVCGLLQDP